MRKTINGKLYDTGKSELIADNFSGYLMNDFRYCYERLYKTEDGRFFIHGDGGPWSDRTSFLGERYASREAIIPVSEATAKAFSEEYLSADDYEAVFGEVAE